MPYLELPPAEGDTDRWAPVRKMSRLCVCGLLYGAAFAVMAPASPGLRVSQTQDITAIIPRIMTDFLGLNFFTAAFTYNYAIDKRNKEMTAGGWLPWLGPISAFGPAFTCLVASHMFYPGQWALYCEPTWRTKLREFFRLNMKCLVAFSYYHVPPVAAMALVIGVLFYPYKYFRRKRLAERDATTRLLEEKQAMLASKERR